MVAASIAGRPGSNLFKKYEMSMQKNPLQTKMATCVVGFGMGDVVAQTACWFKAPQLPEMPRRNFFKDLDYTRIVRMGAFGGLLSAPQMHVFFGWLDKVVMPMAPKHPLAILTKVGADQLFNSPIGTASFFMWTQTMKGQPQQGLTEIGEKLWPTTLIAWRLWPAAQAINFLMVPAHLRIVYINVVAIAWTTILSSLAN